ncbi:hypothetical protein ABZ341_40485 [Streptomyces sp. NPDC006173]|uniref:hypothetical protein n=1 Tax=Streptomyces sp. NPDC006173 TaxID=3155349 RepID=UPI0033EDB77E
MTLESPAVGQPQYMVAAPEPPAQLRQMIQQIVAAVREGDDARIHILLQDFAREADFSAVLALRRQLYRDLDADQSCYGRPAGRRRKG